MLLALNAFKVVSSGPPPAASRTSIGLLLALTRPLVTGPIEPPVEPPASNYAGGVSRGRMIRKFKRKREELEELLEAIGVTPSEPLVEALQKLPPQPGLLADVPAPLRTVLRSLPDEDEDEIALLLELLS